MNNPEIQACFKSYDLLNTVVFVLNQDGLIVYANSSAENLLELSSRFLCNRPISRFFKGELLPFSGDLCRQIIQIETMSGLFKHVNAILSKFGLNDSLTLLECHVIEQQIQHDRETRLQDQSFASKELIRNLAHEIKNPLGGIRGAAQLLDSELSDPALHEFTQVIISEADRLTELVEQLLVPHRSAHIVKRINIHQVCERVRTLIQAQYPRGLTIKQDYDTSIPEFEADFVELVQVLLNIVQNAAQALAQKIAQKQGKITLKTRIMRKVTLSNKTSKLAVKLDVIDNGPGIEPQLQERIFLPLVSGRDGGTGLGLTLAYTFVQHHQGTISCKSVPGHTVFSIVLPIQ